MSYNQIRSLIDTSSNQILKPLTNDHTIEAITTQHSISPKTITKSLQRINQIRSRSLKRVYNKQAITLISLQILEILKLKLINKYKNLLNLKIILTPLKLSKEDNHEFKLIEKEDNLLDLIQDLPSGEDLGHDDTEYDEIIQTLLQNLQKYKLLQHKLNKYKSLQNQLIKIESQKLQKNLIISSNNKIINQMNKTRILIEKIYPEI